LFPFGNARGLGVRTPVQVVLFLSALIVLAYFFSDLLRLLLTHMRKTVDHVIDTDALTFGWLPGQIDHCGSQRFLLYLTVADDSAVNSGIVFFTEQRLAPGNRWEPAPATSQPLSSNSWAPPY